MKKLAFRTQARTRTPRGCRVFAIVGLVGIGLCVNGSSASERTPWSIAPDPNLEMQSVTPIKGSKEEKIALLELASRSLGEDQRYRLLEITDKLYATFPDDEEVCQRCGFYWIQAAEWERLAPLLASRRTETDTPVVTLRAGITAARERRLLDSLVLLEAAYRADPDEPKILLNLGSFYCRFGRCEEGLRLFQRITDLAPDDPYGFLAVAKAAKALRQPEVGVDAINAAEAIIQRNPVYPERLSEELEGLVESFVQIEGERRE